MGRPRGSGLNVVRKRKPDGGTVEYYYDRETRAFLGHDRNQAEARLARDRAPVANLPAGSLAALIVRYLGRPEFGQLAPRTQALYRGYLDAMRREYGDMAIRDIRPSTIEHIKRAYQETPRKANQILALFRLLLGYAVKLDLLAINPASRPGRIAERPRDEVWSHEAEAAFLAAAPAGIRLAFMLLLYTVQRPSDVLAMTTCRLRDHGGRLWMSLRQAKTGALVDVPVHRRLEPLLRDRLARTVTIGRTDAETLLLVPSPTGLPWSYRNFCRAWDAVPQEGDHRQRRDLRRTGIVRLAEAGATTPQIAALSGHGIDYCQRIIDTYLPRRGEVALGGIELWEAGADANRRVLPIGKATRQQHSANVVQTCKPKGR